MITIDDKYRLEDFGLKALDVFEDPSSTPFTENTMQVPKNDFTLLISEQSQPRPIKVIAILSKDNHIDIEETLNNLVDIFYDDDGKRRKLKLKLDHWQGKFAYAYIASEVRSDRRRNLASVELNFICYDPNRYSSVLANEVMWGSEIIDFTSHYKLGHEGNVTNSQVTSSQDVQMNIWVDGLTIYPQIIIDGSSSDLQIIANGETINLPSFTNRRWIIERFTTTNNGQEVFVNARKFKLKPGANLVTIRGNNKNFSISFNYRDRYK